jgi:hypothetical protein
VLSAFRHERVSDCHTRLAQGFVHIHQSTLSPLYQVVSYQIKSNVEMSEVAKPVEATPAPTAVGGTDSTPVPSTASAAAATGATPAADTITSTSETAPAASKEIPIDNGAAKVEGVPASEGILGYKGPGLIQ